MVVMPIDMPSNCWDCPCHAEFAFCNLMIDTGDGDDKEYEYDYNLKCIPEGRDLRKNRRENCPLVEVQRGGLTMNNRIRQIAKAEKMVRKYYDYLEWLEAVNGGSRYWSDKNR